MEELCPVCEESDLDKVITETCPQCKRSVCEKCMVFNDEMEALLCEMCVEDENAHKHAGG